MITIREMWKRRRLAVKSWGAAYDVWQKGASPELASMFYNVGDRMLVDDLRDVHSDMTMIGEIVERDDDWPRLGPTIVAMQILGDRARAKFALPKSYREGRGSGLLAGCAIAYFATGYWFASAFCAAIYIYAIFNDRRRNWHGNKA